MSNWENKPVLEKVNHYLRQIERPEAGRDHSSELHYLYRLRNELTDKERELVARNKYINEIETRMEKRMHELTAANAVVEVVKELHQELRQQLTDKERELQQKHKIAMEYHGLWEKADDKLAAANAVVEAADKTIDALCHELATWETDGIHKQSTIDRREKAILKYRKLQGGE